MDFFFHFFLLSLITLIFFKVFNDSLNLFRLLPLNREFKLIDVEFQSLNGQTFNFAGSNEFFPINILERERFVGRSWLRLFLRLLNLDIFVEVIIHFIEKSELVFVALLADANRVLRARDLDRIAVLIQLAIITEEKFPGFLANICLCRFWIAVIIQVTTMTTTIMCAIFGLAGALEVNQAEVIVLFQFVAVLSKLLLVFILDSTTACPTTIRIEWKTRNLRLSGRCLAGLLGVGLLFLDRKEVFDGLKILRRGGGEEIDQRLHFKGSSHSFLSFLLLTCKRLCVRVKVS